MRMLSKIISQGEININDALPQAGAARATANAIFLVTIGGSVVRVMVSLGIPLHLQQVPQGHEHFAP